MHPLAPFTSTNLVMTFHGIPSAAWFRRALETISRWYRFATLEEVQRFFGDGEPLQRRCLITFDDGERSFVRHALPVLEALNAPAVLFVSPGVLGGGRNYWFQELRTLRAALGDDVVRQAAGAALGLTAADSARFSLPALLKSLPLAQIEATLDALAARHAVALDHPWNLSLDEVQALDRHPLVTVGAHSMHHPILANEGDEVARREIAGSVSALQSLLGRPVDSFAYPNGARGLDFGAREQGLLRDCSVRLAFATDTGFFGPRSDPLAIPRAALGGAESPGVILARLTAVPVWDRLRTGRERRERLALRSVFRTQLGIQANR